MDRITAGLRALAPPGWQRLEASFALTVVTESALFVVDDGHGPIRCQVSDEVWASVRRHRQVSAELESEPWWRMVVRADAEDVEVVVDHGAEPFPGEQLFAPQAYLADLVGGLHRAR
ncbi:hypothetical protein [Nocardia sp. NRRL WC-3656]|uniref:hypothetical protein n=1 Tax=Nocardia sp. NRRL WC-3656 TaxID=1463824 RepID=UPI00068E25D5|nr:hypothetical protein [Nocardia sp. NRRL WC-3656]